MSTDLVVQGTELVPSGTLFGTDSPAEVVQRASQIARTLEQVVRSQNLVVKIGQGEHVRVEGWTFLGSMLGVFPVVQWTRPVLKDDESFGWEARVEARTRTGEVVGAAEAECLRSEPPWSFFPPPNKWGKTPPARDDFALRSMAQTRAVSKALRLPLGFVMQLAGFNPTPAEEMTVIEGRTGSPGEPRTDASVPQPPSASGEAEQAASPGDVPFGDDYDAPILPAGSEAHLYISEDQRTRLFTIASKAGVPTEPDVRDIVREFTGQESTKLIKKGGEYDGVIAAIQAKASA